MRKIVKDGSPKPTGAPVSVEGVAASRNDEDRRRTLKWMLVTVALLAAVTVAVASLGFSFLNDSKSPLNASNASVATFVGSETCAGCHRAQAELWHTSQDKHAMDHATDKSVLGDFSRMPLISADQEAAFACSVMRPKSMPPLHTATTTMLISRRTVPPATCQREPTWWLTVDMITASASPGPTSRQKSARQTPVTIVTPTNLHNGLPTRLKAGMARSV
jgi:hypothetical protein